jgi:hypothetical protein
MIIDVEFDASTKGAPTGFFTAVNAAVEFWERELTNPITVTMRFGYNSVDGMTIGANALAESVSEGIDATFAQVKAGLTSAATSANDHTSVANLPAGDPTGGAGYFVPYTEAEVFGLAPTANTLVGFAGLSSAFPFTFDPNDRSVPGDYDAIGAMEHEISEVIGRIAGSGALEGGVKDFSPLDLFRYVSAGHLAVTPEAAFFSIDGTHLLRPFNDPTTGNDAGDWGNSVSGDSFGFGSQGVAGLVSPTDLEVMDVLGFKLAPDPTASNDFNADGRSDFLIQNTAGAVDVGEIFGGKAYYIPTGSLGAQWTFEGDGDFLGAGSDQYLTENTSGAIDATQVSTHAAVISHLGTLGPQWKFVGVGDYLGLADGDQFLIQNTAGTLDVANAESGTAFYTPVGSLASNWTFDGSGDFLGDGRSDFLIENTAGSIDVGEVTDGRVTYTRIGSVGLTWKFVGTGDFFADGKDQFLIENTAGAVDVVEVTGGKAAYTHITTIAPSWTFVGTGDFLADGHDQFLIENTSGALEVGNWASGQVQVAQVGSLGSQWRFHDDNGALGGAGGAQPAAIRSAATPSAAGFAQTIGGFAVEPFAVVGAHAGSSDVATGGPAFIPAATSRP